MAEHSLGASSLGASSLSAYGTAMLEQSVQTERMPAVNPMDYMHDTAMDIVGDEVMDAGELVAVCYDRIDDALQAWADLFHIKENDIGVQKILGEIVFCSLEEAANVGTGDADDR